MEVIPSCGTKLYSLIAMVVIKIMLLLHMKYIQVLFCTLTTGTSSVEFACVTEYCAVTVCCAVQVRDK